MGSEGQGTSGRTGRSLGELTEERGDAVPCQERVPGAWDAEEATPGASSRRSSRSRWGPATYRGSSADALPASKTANRVSMAAPIVARPPTVAQDLRRPPTATAPAPAIPSHRDARSSVPARPAS